MITYTILMRRSTSAQLDPEKLFLQQLTNLWPAIKGSIAQVRKTCLRPHCQACARGDKHPAFILSFTQSGKRRCMYVPKDLVPLIERALHNGRQIESLLYQLGPMLLQQHRQQRGPKPEI
jgi:hypothetical protein